MTTQQLMNDMYEKILQLIDWRRRMLDEGRERLKKRLSMEPDISNDDGINAVIVKFDESYVKTVERRLECFKNNFLKNEDLIAYVSNFSESRRSELTPSCLARRLLNVEPCDTRSLSENVDDLKDEFETMLEQIRQKKEQIQNLRKAVTQRAIESCLNQIKPSLDFAEEKVNERVERAQKLFAISNFNSSKDGAPHELESCDAESDASSRRRDSRSVDLEEMEIENLIQRVNRRIEKQLKIRGVTQCSINPYGQEELVMYNNEVCLLSHLRSTDVHNGEIKNGEFDPELESTPKILSSNTNRGVSKNEQQEGSSGDLIDSAQQQGCNGGNSPADRQETYRNVPLKLRGGSKKVAVKLF